jgi:hypothetical protein
VCVQNGAYTGKESSASQNSLGVISWNVLSYTFWLAYKDPSSGSHTKGRLYMYYALSSFSIIGVEISNFIL